jgi:hypothetical protein
MALSAARQSHQVVVIPARQMAQTRVQLPCRQGQMQGLSVVTRGLPAITRGLPVQGLLRGSSVGRRTIGRRQSAVAGLSFSENGMPSITDLPSLAPEVGQPLIYAVLGLSALSFCATFFLAPRFRDDLKACSASYHPYVKRIRQHGFGDSDASSRFFCRCRKRTIGRPSTPL